MDLRKSILMALAAWGLLAGCGQFHGQVDARTVNRGIADSLKMLASAGSAQPLNCGESPLNDPDKRAAECAVQAFQNRTAFYVRYYVRGGPFDYSYGLAGDANGNVSEVVYNSRGINKLGLPRKARLSQESRLAIVPCAKPVSLTRTEEGAAACALPPSQPWRGKPIDTSICEIVKKPWLFNNKMVRVRGKVSGNFEYSTIGGEGCPDAIWFAYGDGSGPPGLVAYVPGGATPGGENKEGDRTAPIPVKLARDVNFQKFERLMAARARADARSDKKNPDHLVFHQVTATFIGRIDGVTPEIHAVHQKRSPTDRADYLGFGQMGLFDAQFVIQSVENDAVLSAEK